MSKKPTIEETVTSDVPTTGSGTHYNLTDDERKLLERAAKVEAAQKKWRDANPEKVKSYQAKWRADNKDKVVAAHKRYQERNPEKVAAWHKKAQAKQRDMLRKAKELMKQIEANEKVS